MGEKQRLCWDDRLLDVCWTKFCLAHVQQHAKALMQTARQVTVHFCTLHKAGVALAERT